MKLPSNMTESQVMAAIEKMVNILAPTFKFGYFDVDDIKQEARIYAMNAMQDYDEKRPLENFLYKHIKNRLINFRRDKYSRNDPPCPSCAATPSLPTEHPDGQYCERYLKWRKRNSTKRNLLVPLDISNISHEKETRTHTGTGVVEDAEREELLQMIDRKLPMELRAAYLQMRAGARLPKSKREEVERIVLDILKENLPCNIKRDQ